MAATRVVNEYLILCCFLNALLIFAFYQDDYNLKLEILRILDYNRSYLRDIKGGLVWYNRTTRTFNVSGNLLRDLGTDIQMTIQGYKFLSNEYRLFALQMKINLCQEAKLDRFGVVKTFQMAANFKLDCPVKKGFLALTHATIDQTKLAPHAIGGKYRFQLKFYEGPNYLAEAHIDFEIIEKIKKWEIPKVFR